MRGIERPGDQTAAKAGVVQLTKAAALQSPTGDDLKIVALDYVLLNDYSDAVRWLEKAVERVLAEGSGAVWTVQIQGKRDNGEAFTSSMFNYSGGMGARATKPGPSATCYPTGVAAVPVEILDAFF